jgi:murein DD-endopeptidase MepM/ murein hydrolase activator NlpD
LVDTLTLQHLRSQLPHEPPPLSPPLAQVPVPRPTAVTPPAFILTEAGPQGCPIQPSNGQVVITQGYAVGTHAPATVWGAVDLAVDSNGDGYAEPGATWYTPVVATHAGHVRVTLNSYPAGNHVWVEASHTPWRTGYAHLAIITVISEQYVQPGDVIGLIGSSGMSSGPHLDYQIWQGETNIDPTPLIGCANAPSL